MRAFGSTPSQLATITITTTIATVLLLVTPMMVPQPADLYSRLAIVAVALPLFLLAGFQVIERRAGLPAALVVFLGGLIIELLSFAFLYQDDGVLRAVVTKNAAGVAQVTYQGRHDLVSCGLLSVQVWTSGGDGSLMAMPSQGWLTAIELLLGYVYMAIFIAVLVTVLQQHLEHEREREESA